VISSRATEGTALYRSPSKALRQGDVALAEFHQLRARGGEPAAPGESSAASPDVPYLGPYRDYPLELSLPGTEEKKTRVLRVWVGYVLLLHQSCEIEYADEADSRLIVSPLVLRNHWSSGPWSLIERDELPGFMYLPRLSEEDAEAIGCKKGIPEAAVAFASTTLLSRAIFKPNRLASLRPEHLGRLQASAVRFFSVRGWASTRELANLVGKTVVDAQETAESVPGPSRLAKVLLRGEEGSDDEVTVTWGLRSSR